MFGETYFCHDDSNLFKRPTFGTHSDTNLTKTNASVPKKKPVEHSTAEETDAPFSFPWGEPKYSACGKEILFLS